MVRSGGRRLSILFFTLAWAFATVGVSHASLRHIDAGEAARAMLEDRYFSDYGIQAIYVRGILQSVEKKSASQILIFWSPLDMQVRCHIKSSRHFRRGQSITVIASGAERMEKFLDYRDCETTPRRSKDPERN